MDPKEIKIVVPLKDQERLYEQLFEDRARETGISRKDLPEVVTIDVMRGQQSRVVIYDMVVTCGDGSHGLGIVGNEFRANLAVTRASDTLIIIGSSETVDVFPKFWSWMMLQEDMPSEPLPYAVQYILKLKEAGLSFPARTPVIRHRLEEFRVKPEWFKKDHGFLEWEYEIGHTGGYDRN